MTLYAPGVRPVWLSWLVAPPSGAGREARSSASRSPCAPAPSMTTLALTAAFWIPSAPARARAQPPGWTPPHSRGVRVPLKRKGSGSWGVGSGRHPAKRICIARPHASSWKGVLLTAPLRDEFSGRFPPSLPLLPENVRTPQKKMTRICLILG